MSNVGHGRNVRSSSTTVTPYFPKDIILNIISKIAVDSHINSSRLVSKLWYNHMYQHRQPKPARLLIQNIAKSTKLVEFNEERDQAIGLRSLNNDINCFGCIKSTCNGLVLMVQSYSDDDQGNKPYHIHVLNPLTKECISLPPCKFSQFTEWFGIAFIPSSMTFKVVLAFNFGSTLRCEILTLGSSSDGKWRTIKIPATSRLSLYCTEKPVSVNGVIHLKTGARSHLISIDASDETIHKTKLPNSRIVLKNMHLIEMRGSLGLIQHFYVLMEIYVLKDFRKGEWTKIGRFDIEDPRPMISSNSYQIQLIPVASFRNGQVIIFRILDDYGNTVGLFSYTAGHLKLKKIEMGMDDITACFPYAVASFFLLGPGQVDKKD